MNSSHLRLLGCAIALAAVVPAPTVAGRAAHAGAGSIRVTLHPQPQGFDDGFLSDDFGDAVVCCDLDGNGDTEVVVGAPNAVPPGFSEPMRSVFIYDAGDPQPRARIDVTDEAGTQFGKALACCRVPGVGALLLVGAPRATHEGVDRSGAMVVIRFENGVPVQDRVIGGEEPGENLGAELCCADLNHDGSPELLASGPFDDAPENPGHVDIFNLAGQRLRTLRGEAARDGFGDELLCCDLNGDGFDEVVVGSESARPGGRDHAGSGWVYQGRSAQALRLVRRLDGPAAGDHFGEFLACGQPQFGFPNGFFRNLVVGSEAARGTGTYTVFNGQRLNLGRLYTRAGQTPGEQFGSSLAVCRLTRGRVPVIVVGAEGADDGAGRVDLFSERGVFYRSLTAGKFNPGSFGDFVTCCDWNGDGIDDILVSASGNEENGAVFVFSGVDAALLATLNAAAG